MDNRLKNFKWVGGTQSQGSDNNKYYPRHQSPTKNRVWLQSIGRNNS